MKVIVFGGTGFIGQSLCKALEARKHSVLKADIRSTPHWQSELESADAVINLAGAPLIGKRWSDAVQSEIHASRVEGTNQIVKAMGAAHKKTGKPTVLVNGSAIGFYGAQFDQELNEQSPAGTDFLAFVCKEWEEAARRAQLVYGIRTVIVRTGVVLGKNGGALQKLLPPFKAFVGGPVASGKQWMSWIHIDDIVGIFIHALETPSVTGVLNGSAPEAKTNKDFSKTLGHVLHRPSFIPVPGLALYALIGGAAEMLINGQRVVPTQTLASGYSFKFPTLEPALKNILT